MSLRAVPRPSWSRSWLGWFWIRSQKPTTGNDMAKGKPEKRMPEWVRDELEKAYHRIQNLTAARRLWDRVFTERIAADAVARWRLHGHPKQR